ncbi:hypothetical protein [Halorientalis halophila]|uniref:hypothetical protein n=1 Tax=Halorientalis halophila TaxID=3108499 RepID=UPI0030090EF4
MPSNTNRRRFIQLAGAAAALSVAGCNALESDGTPTDGEDTTDDGSTSGSNTVTLQVQLGQEAQLQLQQQQRQLQSQIQSGELSRAEAQSELQDLAAEQYGQVIDSFESKIEGEDVTVEDSLPAFGVLLVSGDADAVLDTLELEEVGSIRAESEFESLQSRAEQTDGQTPAPTAEPDGTATTEPTGTADDEVQTETSTDTATE